MQIDKLYNLLKIPFNEGIKGITESSILIHYFRNGL